MMKFGLGLLTEVAPHDANNGEIIANTLVNTFA